MIFNMVRGDRKIGTRVYLFASFIYNSDFELIMWESKNKNLQK